MSYDIDELHLSEIVDFESKAFEYAGRKKRSDEIDSEYYFLAYFQVTGCSGESFWYSDFIGQRFLGLCTRDYHKERLYETYRNRKIMCLKSVVVYRAVGRKFFQTGNGFVVSDITLI